MEQYTGIALAFLLAGGLLKLFELLLNKWTSNGNAVGKVEDKLDKLIENLQRLVNMMENNQEVFASMRGVPKMIEDLWAWHNVTTANGKKAWYDTNNEDIIKEIQLLRQELRSILLTNKPIEE